jgi:hypothetical protein
MAENTTTPTAPKKDKLAKYREEFNKLSARKAEITKKLQPHREFLDKAAADPKLAEARKVIKESKPELFEIETDLAHLAVLLGTKRMEIEPGTYTKK